MDTYCPPLLRTPTLPAQAVRPFISRRHSLSRVQARFHIRKLGLLVVHPHPLDADLSGDRRARLHVMAPPQIQLLTASDIPVFRALRLDALRQHPEAFIPTYEEERSADPAFIAARFRNDWISDGNFILGAFREGRLVGAIGVRRWSRHKQRHRATVWLLFTDPSVRGQGLGRELLTAAIERCQHDRELELLHLSVGVESGAARNLYARVGFRSYGVEPKAIKLAGRYIDVELMVLDLKDAPLA